MTKTSNSSSSEAPWNKLGYKLSEEDAKLREWPKGEWVCTVCDTKYTHKEYTKGKVDWHPNKTWAWRSKCTHCRTKEKQAYFKAKNAERVQTKENIKANQQRWVNQGTEALRKWHAEQRKEKAINQRAKEELASRELARRSLLHYVERNVKDYEAGWVHEDICRRLEKFMKDVEDKKSPRLMIWVPPRHGKSEIASVQYPSWVLGHHPEWEFISASYSVDLPIKFSRVIRARLKAPEYTVLFPGTKLRGDSQAAEDWRTDKGGGYRAAGVGGGITGMGAHVLVIDDPVKDMAEADSETIRSAVWDWFGSTAYTRLAPGGGVLVIQTRWHDDDLSGRLERQMREGAKEVEQLRFDAKKKFREARNVQDRFVAEQMWEEAKKLEASIDKWEIVKYPALATDDEYLNKKTGAIVRGSEAETQHSQYRLLRRKGQALHPARFNETLLSKYKRTLQPRAWSALYQQSPTPDEGMFFTKDMFRFRPHLPDHREMTKFVAWDLAVGMKAHNDYTVGVVGALDWEDNIWILDVVRGKWQTHQIAENIIDTHLRYDAVMTGIEKGQLELAIKPQLEKRMRERKAYITLAEGNDALRPITDKIVRARPLQGRMQQGRVIVPSDQTWVETLMSELLRFPTGLHDDIVDGCAWLIRMMLDVQPPPRPSERTRTKGEFKSWKDRLNGLAGRRRHHMAA